MEHFCANCNSLVSDESAFCPHCGAAQVRYVARANASAPVAIAAAGPAGILRTDAVEPVQQRAPLANSRAAFRSALIAGAVAVFFSILPLGPVFLFTLPLAGLVSVLLYRRHLGTAEVTPAVGFRLGAATGLAGFIMLIVLTAIEAFAFHAENELRSALLQAVKQAQGRYSDPQARQALDYFLTPHGLISLMIFGSLFMCVLFVLFSGVGGALSAALLRRKRD